MHEAFRNSFVVDELKKVGVDEDDFDANGLYIRPGKFEGEFVETIYYYALMMEGAGEEIGQDEDIVTAFDPSIEEREVFDFDEETYRYSIEVSDNGLVFGTELTGEEYNELVEGVF